MKYEAIKEESHIITFTYGEVQDILIKEAKRLIKVEGYIFERAIMDISPTVEEYGIRIVLTNPTNGNVDTSKQI